MRHASASAEFFTPLDIAAESGQQKGYVRFPEIQPDFPPEKPMVQLCAEIAQLYAKVIRDF